MTNLLLKIRTFFNSVQIAFKKMWKDVKKRNIFIIVTSVVMAVVITTVTLCCVFLIPEKEREITLYMHGFDGVEQSIVINNKEKYTLPTLQKDYYDFLGWYFDKEYTSPVPEDYFETYDYKRNVRVYSKWNMRDPIVISFYTQGGTAVDSEIVPKGMPIDKSWYSQRQGYTLVGWCYDENLLTVFMPGDKFYENTILYAKWLPNEITEEDVVTITFDANGGEAVPNQTIKIGSTIVLPSTNRIGYDFIGWYTDSSFKYPYKANATVTKSLTLYAKWQENGTYYTLSFETRGGTLIESVRYLNGTKINVNLLPKPTKTDDRFEYWCTDSEVEYRQANDFFIKKDVTLYARWASDSPIVTEWVNIYYHLDKESIPELAQIEKYTKIENRTYEKSDRIFVGWYADEELTRPFDFSIMAYGDTHLYAKWEDRPTYSDTLFAYELSEDETYLILVKRIDRTSSVVTIPDECKGLPIKEIGESAFANSIVTRVNIGKNITTISQNAFTESLLQEIIIPNNVVLIDEYAFQGVNNLTAVEIEGDAWVKDYAFEGCDKLKTFTANKVTKIDRFAFENCIDLERVKINKIASLGIGVFNGCRALEQVEMTNATIAELPMRAFQSTLSLKTIVIPSTVTTIGGEAFSGSGLLTLDTRNVTTIYSGAFSGCSMLGDVFIRKSANVIKVDAFANSPKTAFYVDADNATYESDNGSLYSKGKVQLVYYSNKIGVSHYTLPKNVMAIGLTAFSNANDLASISVEDGNMTFKAIDGCLYSIDETIMYLYPVKKQGTTFTVRNGVRKIERFCFYNNVNLETVILPYSVTAINLGGFFRLKNLTEIKYANASVLGTYSDSKDIGGLSYGNNGGVCDCGNGSVIFTQSA